MNDICTPIRERFSFYLDGDVNGLEMQQIGAHLDTCPSCRTEFAEWKSMQRALMAARSAPLPENLAVRLRVALSHERSDAQRTFVQRFVDRWELYRDNTLRPFGVQAAVAVAAVVLLVLASACWAPLPRPRRSKRTTHRSQVSPHRATCTLCRVRRRTLKSLPIGLCWSK